MPSPGEPEATDSVRATLAQALGTHYRVERLLGRGGMGAVYLAHEAGLDRDVAIKVLPPERTATAATLERFRREARTAARLSHPHIVPLHAFGEQGDTAYYVMGYVRGESLAARLHREGPLPEVEVRRITIALAEALQHAHEQGVVHRDVKPDNVLLEEGSGRPLLTDFGIARGEFVGDHLTGTGSILGTPDFMSPEQAAGRPDVDARSDVYSLGVTAYAMLSGRLPFEARTPGEALARRLTEDPSPLRPLVPQASETVAISRGFAGSEPKLIAVLDKQSVNSTIGLIFLNSGNPVLDAAARKWASRTGRTIETKEQGNALQPRWGAGRR